MKPLTHEWSQKAEGDYTVAATLWQAESAVYDAICFHAQQCIEKYLKACSPFAPSISHFLNFKLPVERST